MPIAPLPPIPSEVPLLVETSHSHNYGPEHHGIDTATQWWCLTTRRPRFGDAIAMVTPPATKPYYSMLNLVLAADDLDDTEAVGHYAIRIARYAVRLVADRNDEEAMAELKRLLAPSGPLGKGSQQAWHNLLTWLDSAAANDDIEAFGAIEIDGWGGPEELWTVSEVAKYLGYSGDSANGSARKQLSRWGLKPEGRQPGRGGESLFAADQVRDAHENRPGRGRWAESRRS